MGLEQPNTELIYPELSPMSSYRQVADLALEAVSDFTTAPTTRTLAGVSWALGNQAAAVWGLDGTDGMDISPNASVSFVGGGVRSGPCIFALLADLIPGFTWGDDVAVAVRVSYATAPTTGTSGLRVGVVDGDPTDGTTKLLTVIGLPSAVQKGDLQGGTGSADGDVGAALPALGLMFRLHRGSIAVFTRATDFSVLAGDDAPGGKNWSPVIGATSGTNDMNLEVLDANDVATFNAATTKVFIGAQGGSGAQDWACTVRSIHTWKA